MLERSWHPQECSAGLNFPTGLCLPSRILSKHFQDGTAEKCAAEMLIIMDLFDNRCSCGSQDRQVAMFVDFRLKTCVFVGQEELVCIMLGITAEIIRPLYFHGNDVRDVPHHVGKYRYQTLNAQSQQRWVGRMI